MDTTGQNFGFLNYCTDHFVRAGSSGYDKCRDFLFQGFFDLSGPIRLENMTLLAEAFALLENGLHYDNGYAFVQLKWESMKAKLRSLGVRFYDFPWYDAIMLEQSGTCSTFGLDPASRAIRWWHPYWMVSMLRRVNAKTPFAEPTGSSQRKFLIGNDPTYSGLGVWTDCGTRTETTTYDYTVSPTKEETKVTTTGGKIGSRGTWIWLDEDDEDEKAANSALNSNAALANSLQTLRLSNVDDLVSEDENGCHLPKFRRDVLDGIRQDLQKAVGLHLRYPAFPNQIIAGLCYKRGVKDYYWSKSGDNPPVEDDRPEEFSEVQTNQLVEGVFQWSNSESRQFSGYSPRTREIDWEEYKSHTKIRFVSLCSGGSSSDEDSGSDDVDVDGEALIFSPINFIHCITANKVEHPVISIGDRRVDLLVCLTKSILKVAICTGYNWETDEGEDSGPEDDTYSLRSIKGVRVESENHKTIVKKVSADFLGYSPQMSSDLSLIRSYPYVDESSRICYAVFRVRNFTRFSMQFEKDIEGEESLPEYPNCEGDVVRRERHVHVSHVWNVVIGADVFGKLTIPTGGTGQTSFGCR